MRKTPIKPGSIVKWSVNIKGVICSEPEIHGLEPIEQLFYTDRRNFMDPLTGRLITPNWIGSRPK